MLALLEKRLHDAVSKANSDDVEIKPGPTLGPASTTKKMVAVAVGEFKADISYDLSFLFSIKRSQVGERL